MLIDNTVVYSQKYKVEIGKPGKNLYYFFDYDERSYSINMEFQHFHQFYEMCIFLDEKAGHLIDGVWYDMRCCDIVALRPTLLHKTEYSPEVKEEVTATLEVLQTFHISKVGTIAGCIVREGKIKRGNKVRVIRDGIVIKTAELASLKHVKDDIKEAGVNTECGLSLKAYDDLKEGDILESFEEIEVAKTL